MNQKTILIADDEAHILSVLALKLRGAGYRVLVARTGLEALEQIRRENPDLLITDFHMPELSGLELCQTLRQSEKTRGLAVIMLTARGYYLQAAQTEELGIVRIFSKPFSPRKLVGAVEEILRERSKDAA